MHTKHTHTCTLYSTKYDNEWRCDHFHAYLSATGTMIKSLWNYEVVDRSSFLIWQFWNETKKQTEASQHTTFWLVMITARLHLRPWRCFGLEWQTTFVTLFLTILGKQTCCVITPHDIITWYQFFLYLKCYSCVWDYKLYEKLYTVEVYAVLYTGISSVPAVFSVVMWD